MVEMTVIAPPLAFIAATVAIIAMLRGLLHRGIRNSLAAPRIPHDCTPDAFGLHFESVRIDTANQRCLHGWLIAPVTGTRAPYPAMIVMHGWGGNAAMMLPLARPLHNAGFATLFLDARGHGASDDDSFASLPRFAEDVEHALEWLAARASIDAGRIGLIGHSVGAGAALLVASRRRDVAVVVSVAAFSHPAGMMRRWLATKRIPEWPAGRYILGYVQKTIGHRFDDIAPVKQYIYIYWFSYVLTAVWTGTEMIVWGGITRTPPCAPTNTGGRYNPLTGAWAATSTKLPCPAPSLSHSATWTGQVMSVRGGTAPGVPSSRTGGRYNPATDTWAAGTTERRRSHSHRDGHRGRDGCHIHNAPGRLHRHQQRRRRAHRRHHPGCGG